MPVLNREALQASPLADLHAIASELSIDGYRRLRRDDLIDAILATQGESGDGGRRRAAVTPARRRDDQPTSDGDDGELTSAVVDELRLHGDEQPRRRRGRRGGRARAGAREPAVEAAARDELAEAAARDELAEAAARDELAEAADRDELAEAADRDELAEAADRDELAARDELTEAAARDELAESPADDHREDSDRESPPAGAPPEPGESVVEGVVELAANGSAFLRLQPPHPSEDDVYISAAQVKRCELVSGDRVSGRRRDRRRSERYPSLIRVDTINGQPAEEVADRPHFDELPARFPSERFAFGSDDPTINSIEWLTPIGKGSRVTIVGGPLAGKTEALRRLAAALSGHAGLEVSLALAGVRPEELAEWPLEPAVALALGASADAQAQAIELVLDTGRRIAGRGADAVVLIDTLDGLGSQLARRLVASARNLVAGGSLTVIATANQPVGGETTVIALDPRLTSTGRFPALNLIASATMRPELLVGEAGAEAIREGRAQALAALSAGSDQ